MRPLSFRTKLIAGALAPLVIAAGIQAIYSVVSQRREALAGLETKAHAVTNLLVNVAGPSMATDDPSGVDDGLAFLERDADFGFALAVGADGKVIAYRGPATERGMHATAAAITTEPRLSSAPGLVIASYPVRSKDRTLGELVVGLRTTSAHARAARLTEWAALISLFGIAAAVGVVLVLASRIVRRNREMKNLLDHMDQGFLSMHRDGTLALERSAIAEKLVGPYVPAQTLWQALAPVHPQTAMWLELGWTEVLADVMPLELTLSQLPSHLELGERTYRIEYKPTVTAGVVGDTLVVLTDTTAELARDRAEAAERDLLRLIERMARDRAGSTEFLEETDRLIGRLEAADVSAISDELKRDIHTLKGNCGMIGLTQIAERCHHLEDRLAATSEVDPGATLAVTSAWHELRTKVARVFGGTGGPSLDVSASDLMELRGVIARGANLGSIEQIVRGWSMERTRGRLERFAEQAQGLSERLGKPIVDIEILDHGVRVDPTRFRSFWAVFAHIVRNAVDHGIESAEDRALAGKPAAGRLVLRTTRDGENFVVEIADDGRGIDWERVRDRARASGHPHRSESDLVDAIFSDGITTRDEVSETSGRGVGLAAVRDACEGLGGTIGVTSELGRGTRFRFTFPLGRAVSTLIRVMAS